MLTNNKKNFVRSISMLLAMLMVLAVCLTGCGNKTADEALAKAEEAKTTADSVMEALSGYIAKDDTAAVQALVEAALNDSVATADELDALAAKLEAYVTADDVAALIKDEVAKATLGSAMTKDEILEILKGYYTKEEVDAKLESYFGEFAPEQVLAMLTDVEKVMNLKDWNAASDVVLETIEDMQVLLDSIQNKTYTWNNMVLLNEKLAPLGIVAFEDTDLDGKITPNDRKLFDADKFAKLLEYTILRVATLEEVEELKAAVEEAVAVPTFESEFAALQAKLFALGELVTVGSYNADDKFTATPWAADGYYHGVAHKKGDDMQVQVVTLADKAGFHEFAKAHDALVAKYIALAAIPADTTTNGWLNGATANKVYEVSNSGKLAIKIVALSDDAPDNATERGFIAYTTLADTAANVDYLTKLYLADKLYSNEVLSTPLYPELSTWINNRNISTLKGDFKNTGKFEVIYADARNVQSTADTTNAWQKAYGAAFKQLTYVQYLADMINDEFQGNVVARNDYKAVLGKQVALGSSDFYANAFLLNTIYNNNTAMITKGEYAAVADAEFLAALTAAMCEYDGATTYPKYLVDMADDVAAFLTANGLSYNGFVKADLYKQMIEKSYDLLWPKYKALAQKFVNTMLNDYISVVYEAQKNTTSNKADVIVPFHADTAALATAMQLGIDNITDADLTPGFLNAFLNGGAIAGTDYAKIGKDFKGHNLAMYYKNNGTAKVSLLAEGEEYRGAGLNGSGTGNAVADATTVAAAIANPLATIKANAELITLRLTGSKLYVDMQIAGADKEAMKATGVPVQKAFYSILQGAVAGFDEIYNRFLVDSYNSDDLSDYQKMTLNDAAALVPQLVDFYNTTSNVALDEAKYVAGLEQYLSGVSNAGKWGSKTAYSVTTYMITRFTPGKNDLEKTVSNFTLVENLETISVNHFDTSSSEGVAMVGTEAMAAIDLFKDEAIAEMENILIKAKFISYLDVARGSWNELWTDYSTKINVNDYATMSKLNTLISKVNDTIAVMQFYASIDGYELNEYKDIYVGKVLPLIAGKHNATHLALLAGEDIETVLANTAALSAAVAKDALKNIMTSWSAAELTEAFGFKAWVETAKPVTPYASAADYEFVGSAAEELDALLNANTAFVTAPNNAIVNLY